MRYADGGGLTAEGRARREAVRLQAAKMFEQDLPTAQIVARLRVSANSVRVWRRRWRSGGTTALASRGPGGASCRLDRTGQQWLAADLDAGPAAFGYTDDQRWTLARVAKLARDRYRVCYTLRGVSYLLHRMGWTPQVPAHRAVQRDEQAVASWVADTWPQARSSAAATDAFVCFEDEAGQSLRPPKARTWGRRGHTPVVAVSGKGSGRVSMAGLIAARPGARSRLFYRIHTYHGRKHERKGFIEADYQELLSAVHQQVNAPLVVVWDNLNHHVSAAMRAFVDQHDWLSVVRLPPYAPDLNPTEGVWAHVKRDLGNLAARGTDDLAATVRTLLKRIQYRPELIDGFIAATGLSLKPQPP